MDEHLNISSVLAFSEQQEALIAAQQQVTQRVMDNNKMLRDALRQAQEEVAHYKALYEAEQARNARLEAENTALLSRPIQVNGDLIEAQHIDKYFTYTPSKRAKLKNKPTDLTSQLPLWNNTAISM